MLSRRTLLAAAPVLAARPRPPLAAVPISRMDTPWWRARHAQKLAELRQSPPELIFLGDSITQDWERNGPPPWGDYRPAWTRFYGDRHAINLGFIGDATSHLLWRITHGELDAVSPKAAVILIGANNLGRVHWPANENLIGISAVVDETRARLPRTRILLLGILPSIRSAWVDDNTRTINQALATRYAAGAVPNVSFLDIGPTFLTHGTVDKSLFTDPLMTPPEPTLHPTVDGQIRMSLAIEPTLAKLLGDRPKA